MAAAQGPQKVVVVGAGPVGALAALYAANRGDQVELYELRGDPRDESTTPLNFTKSINLALSERGINSMRHSGSPKLVDDVLAETIPMHGRMIHSCKKTGELEEISQKYDVNGRAIHAVDRAGLNKRLLDALEALPNVRFLFNHKLTGADFKNKKAWFERRLPMPKSGKTDADRAPEVEVAFDFLIGADGAHSAARYHLMKFARMDYKQEYIDTLWCEFQIPPVDENFAMSPNHLHIWPGQDFMFIAIPSLDRSFTCTLFAPQHTFEKLAKSPNSLPEFFQAEFPGVSPEHITTTELIQQFTSNPHLPLISIKCSPYHYGSSAVILGDAAHAMVPFYGQGMNAGLEDVRVLFEFLDQNGVYSKHHESTEDSDKCRLAALYAYSNTRVPDASAINDLALHNYHEMRSGVTSRTYLARKFVEESLSKRFPSLGWSTQYSRVSFGNERYSQIVVAVRKQSQILFGTAVGLASLGVVSFVAWMLLRERPKPSRGLLWRGLDLMKDAIYRP